ncbi:MAG: ABC transporter ATP-binding protein [Clostridium sp.]
MNNKALEVIELSKSYERFCLEKINFYLEKGAITGLVGKNGAGKTTILKSIMGILPFDNGEIKVNGISIIDNEIQCKKVMGYVGDHIDYYHNSKLKDISKFISKYYDSWDNKWYHELLVKFKVDDNKKMKELSKGMVVKFSLAVALAHRPEILILDEPTSGLDPVVRSELLDILKDSVTKYGTSILFSSHITEDIVKIADNVIFIDEGEIKLIDEKDELLSRYIKVNSSLKNKNICGNLLFEGVDWSIYKLNNDVSKEDILNQDNNYEDIGIDEILVIINKGSKEEVLC